MSRKTTCRVRSRIDVDDYSAQKEELSPTSTPGDLIGSVNEGTDNCGSSVSTTSSFSSDGGGHRRGTPFGLLYQQYGSQLASMVSAFDELEMELRIIPSSDKSSEEIATAEKRHTKLVTFIKHLKKAQEKLLNGPSTANEVEEAKQLEVSVRDRLLPVYMRLKKQKGDSQGAKTNPKGAPVNHPLFKMANGGPPITMVKTRPPPAPTMFGAPLKGGSFLTQKLHGSTLGSSARRYGYGVGSTTPIHDNTSTKLPQQSSQKEVQQRQQRQIFRGGMAPGSETVLMPPPSIKGLGDIQRRGIVGATPKNQQTPMMTTSTGGPRELAAAAASAAASAAAAAGAAAAAAAAAAVVNMNIGNLGPSLGHEKSANGGNSLAPEIDLERTCSTFSDLAPQGSTSMERISSKESPEVDSHDDRVSIMIEQDLLREHIPQQMLEVRGRKFPLNPPKNLKKPRKKRRKEAQSQMEAHNQVNNVEYLCSECNDLYSTTTTANPWWVVTREDCPKCHKSQIPRIDISLPANAINYHPALVAHENDEDGEGGHHHLVFKGPIDDSNKGMSLGVGVVEGGESESDSDSDSETGEDFGQTYEGPKFTPDEANKLVRLFSHARTCPGKHKSEKHREVCQSVKMMMLHIRDCQGTALGSTTDPCAFPWCRKAKNLVYHIASCDQRATCEVCGPQLGIGLGLRETENYRSLAKLNKARLREEQTISVAVDVQQKVVSDGASSGDDVDSGGSVSGSFGSEGEGSGDGGGSGNGSPSSASSVGDTVTADAAPTAGLKRSGRETKGRKRMGGGGESVIPLNGKAQGRKRRSAKR
ncbi:hypothetical protein TrRE_jg10597 [Triparma retinervis]|uniref:TAZ-type domain-containing protein n=1 Tax=Triparma retinervis TaxID=2557542 RepID=A0A9W7DT67_9STRA|nr:hypothetical protein TrRE_jg10597 [Triparma retinervis]